MKIRYLKIVKIKFKKRVGNVLINFCLRCNVYLDFCQLNAARWLPLGTLFERKFRLSLH